MKFVSVREFRSNAGSLRQELEIEREIVLTANGKPFAMLTPLDPDTVEEEVSAVRQARARLAMNRIREHARAKGLDRMTMKEINDLIAKVRRERQTEE